MRALKVLGRWLARLGLAVAVAVVAWGATGSVMASQGWSNPPRGTLVAVDGRKQRIVCEGERRVGVPAVVFEAGAYSGAADWGFIQPEVAKDTRTCAYDRAGLGWSEPASGPRDPVSLARELDALLQAAGEPGPYVLVGHSMAGLMTRAYIAQFPDKVAGLVLIDAADPAAIAIPEAQIWIARYRRLAGWAAGASQLGLVKPLAPFMANKIGLSGAALAEKRKMFGARRHMAAAAAEIGQTTQGSFDVLTSADARLARMPVAAITAGPIRDGSLGAWKEAQLRAARLSPQGSALNVAAASHTTILGPVHGVAVVEAVRRVLRDAAAGAAP
jgi:pimeloyl-ACP methyl ester carboxylesterase